MWGLRAGFLDCCSGAELVISWTYWISWSSDLTINKTGIYLAFSSWPSHTELTSLLSSGPLLLLQLLTRSLLRAILHSYGHILILYRILASSSSTIYTPALLSRSQEQQLYSIYLNIYTHPTCFTFSLSCYLNPP